jgi:hypothetical protein
MSKMRLTRAAWIVCVAGAALVLPQLASGAVAIERWGAAGRVQHPGTLSYEKHGKDGTVIRLDLSALPAGTKVHRARLSFRREGRYGPGFEIVPVRRVGEGKAAVLKPTGRRVELAPPHWRWFDAAAVVRDWVKGPQRGGLLLLKRAPGFDRNATYLEIAYQGEVAPVPRQVTDVRAYYRDGQVFITFREIEDFAGGKEQITWGELAKRFKGIDYEGPIPNDDEGELRYRVYRSDKPITPATIGQAELVGEAVPGSGYNTCLVPGGDFIKRRPQAVASRLAVEPGKPLRPGTGLFVHTCRRHGKHYYAVVTCLDGVENTRALSEANVAGPVEQRRSAPQPVLQREQRTQLRNEGTYRELWYSYWAVPPQAPRPTRYDLAVGFCPDAMAHPTSLTFTRGHTWGPKPEMPRAEARRGIVMSMSTEPGNGLWTGTNDARDTLKGVEAGTWRPFTHNRQEVLIRWAVKRWDIDEQQIVGSIGAWGMWEIKRADLYAYIHGWGMPEVTKGFQLWNWARGAWGPPEAYQGKPDAEDPFYLQDYTRWVLEDPGEELPYFQIHTGWGAHFTEMGWPPFPRFVRAMMDTKRAFCMQSRAVPEAMKQGIIRIRRGQSVPAFANCSLDDNIGEGDLKSGTAFGQVNGYLVWDSATTVDAPGLYEITVYLWGGDRHGRGAAPLDSCTVDLTPRKCQKFRPKPGRRLRWANISLADGKQVQTGTITADKHGLATIRRLLVTKGKQRIAVRPE